MRLYGSQSRISKSASRYARAHRPIGAFDAARVRRTTPVTAEKARRTKEASPSPVLVPRAT